MTSSRLVYKEDPTLTWLLVCVAAVERIQHVRRDELECFDSIWEAFIKYVGKTEMVQKDSKTSPLAALWLFYVHPV